MSNFPSRHGVFELNSDYGFQSSDVRRGSHQKETFFFSVQFDKTLRATRQTAGKMFPRIAKCIIYHASRHLFRTFKMLLQYLELQIIHVGVINSWNPTNVKRLD